MVSYIRVVPGWLVCAGGAGGQSIACQSREPGWAAAGSAREPVLLLL